jgi:tape measure domain-containing protein
MAKIGRLNVQIGVDLNKFRADMQQAFKTLNSSTAQMQRALSGLQSSFKSVSSSVTALGAAFGGIAIAGFAKDVLQTADAFNQLQAKIKNSLSNVSQFDGVFKQLVESSNRTGVAVDSVAQAFVRLRPAAERLGVTNQELIQFNETFSKMGALAGATSEEVSNAMIQLAQGIASNRLGGDELRSVLEQMPPIAQAIANQMKIPIEKLKDVAKDGKITADVVMNAVLSKTKEVDQQFSKLPASVDRSVNKMVNAGTVFIGKLNDATGATTILSNALDGLANYVNDNSSAFADLAAQLLRTTVEGLKLNPLLWNLGDAIERISKTNINDWMINFSAGLDDITTKAGKAVNEVGRFGENIWNTLTSGGNTAKFAGLDAQTQQKFDFKNEMLEASLLQRQRERIKMQFEAMGINTSGSSGGGGSRHRGGSGGGSKSKNKRAKTDPDIADAKSLAESLKSVWDKERDAIADAQRFLQKHLITAEQYNDAVIKAKRDAHDAFKIEGLDDAMKKFMEPHKKILDDFKTDLGDALNDPAFQQQLKLQDFTDGLARNMEETRRLTEARKQGIETYDEMVRKIQAENDVRSLGIDLMSDEGKLLVDASYQSLTLQDNMEKLHEHMQNFGQVGQEVAGIISNGLEGMIFRGQKFSDVLKDMTLNFAKLLFEESVSKPLAKGLGNLFSNVAGKVLGSFSGFADGGMTPTNQPFWVGENGPELMSSNKSYRVFDHQTSMAMAGAGGGSVHLNQYFTIQTIDNRDFEDRLSENAKTIGNISVRAIQKQENRMGRRGPMDSSRG